MLEQEQYHLVGVAGVGMSALAQAFAAAGRTVSGSDRYYDAGVDLDAIRRLRRAGIDFRPQDGSGVGPHTKALVVSTAIEHDNPDILAANAAGVPILHRAEALAHLVAEKRCIAVTGTSGKSTVTGMIGHVMAELGADPTVVNGAAVLNWVSVGTVGNFRAGNSDWWVIEADESDRSLLKYHPAWAVITNATADHFGLRETLELFERFKRQIGSGLVSTLDEPELLAELRVDSSADARNFEYAGLRFELAMRGRHNAENALLAVVLCERLGFDLKEIRDALSSFKGIHRRLELVGSVNGVTVIDDYAHNPAKIRAAWRAIAGPGRVIGVWRPHGYGPLATMMDDLASAFRDVCREKDLLFVLPVFDAGGTADRSVCAGDLVERILAQGLEGVTAIEPRALSGHVAEKTRPGDTVLLMGARDPGLPALAAEVLRAIGSS